MERYLLFLVVPDDDCGEQKDCQCPEDVITAIQSLVKELCSLCYENKNSPMNTNLLLFDPLLALNNFTPSIHFAFVEDKPFVEKLEFSSKWHGEEQLKELSSFLENAANQGNQNPDKSRNSCSSDGDSEISDRLHQLADGLPDQAGVRTDVFWFICGKSNLALGSHLHLFGALKRLQQWNDAHITVVCSNEFDRNSFTKEWQKGLKFLVTDLKKDYASTNLFNPSVVWQGSLVFPEGQSRTELLGFSLCGERNQNKIEPKLCSKRPKNKNSFANNGNSLCIAPEISILCKVQKNTVPFHMFLPVRLGLSADCSSPKLSARFVEWFSLEKHKDIALIASLSLVTPCKRVSKRENKEAWFNFVQSQDHSTTTKPVSKDGHEDQVSCRRVCLICGDTDKELSLYVLRSPEQLNGWIQQELSSIHSSFLISNDQQVGGPLRFPDLSDSFLATEQNLTEALLRTLQHELEKSDDIFSDDSPSDIMEQLISAKLKILKQKREKLMTDGKEYQLNAVKRDVLRKDTSGLPLTPSKWPERAWLVKNDPNATVKGALAEDTTKPFPLLSSVSSLSIQDILEKFRMDGTPVRSDLVPVQPREESLNGRHILIGISRSADDVKEKLYPESLAESYHGIEYCLDAREAVSKDSQVTHLQSSHVKLETLSSCVQSHKIQTSRSTRNFTKLAKNDKKQSLAKLSVPLNKLEAVVKGKKPTCLTGRSLKKKSPVVMKPAIAAKRKREEPEVKEGKAIQENDDKIKETRSERHKRRLRQVIQKTLEDNGIDSNHPFYKSCTERLYSLCKSFLKDLTSSHGLNDEMKRLAKSNVQQVIDFETKRKSATQQT